MKIAASSNSIKILAGCLTVAAAISTVNAQSQAFMQGGTAQAPLLPAPPLVGTGMGTKVATLWPSNAFTTFFQSTIPKAVAKGKLNLDVRQRYEQVNDEGVPGLTKDSYAPTLRTRFGYTTAPLYGFDGMLEAVNVSVIGPEQNYNAAGANGQSARPLVLDPPLTRIDQAWLGYKYTNWISAKVGEQQINLDNQRFIGDSGWRQNMQTFDAANAGSELLKDFKLYYCYLWSVHRVFGNVNGLPPAYTDFDSKSHLINLAYTGWAFGRIVAYSYLLDLDNSAGTLNSCATYGGFFAGNAPLSDHMAVDYRAEFAWQTDYAGSPLRYGTAYCNLEAGWNIKPLAFGAGYEDLGSGANTGASGGRASFRTPLASLHPFNGWDNVFLTTPVDGLRDLYGYAQVTLPAQIPLRFVYHQFSADYGGGNYGQEFDLLVFKKFRTDWTASVEYAYFAGEDAALPSLSVANVAIQKVWVQLEFRY